MFSKRKKGILGPFYVEHELLYWDPLFLSSLQTVVAHRILSCSQRNMRKSEKAPRRRKRQPPKSGSQNARRALVETEIVWETSSALFLVSSGSLPPMLPSLSSTPRCRWSRKYPSMSRKQDGDDRIGTFAAVRVSSNRVGKRTIIQALQSPFASSLATSSRRRHCPRTRPAAAHA